MTKEDEPVDTGFMNMGIMVDMAAGKDECVKIGYGLVIGLSDDLLQRIRSISHLDPDYYAEVFVQVKDERKEFTLDEFLTLLGFEVEETRGD